MTTKTDVPSKSNKVIKCNKCGTEITVSKWASNDQLCNTCTGYNDVTSDVQPERAIEERPVDKVVKYQIIMEGAGFTITPRGYVKTYQDVDGALYRVEPYLDKGMLSQPSYTVEGFLVTKQELIPVVDPAFNEKVPTVAREDLQSILNQLNIQSLGFNREQVHIDTVKCDKCGRTTIDWIVVSGQTLCLDRCSPVNAHLHEQTKDRV